jgi:hypothetical protein
VLAGILMATMFTLTDKHINLLRKAIVVWAPIESGAPAVMITPLEAGKENGTPEFYADVAKRAGLTSVDKQQIDQLIAEMPQALAQLLAHGKLEAGTYRYDNPLVDLSFAANTLPEELTHLAKEKSVSFAFTARHAKLLRNARWRGMFMNPKRPYGDMTSFERDMAAILDEPADEQKLWTLHTETLPALQVYLMKASIAPGEYARIELERPLF